MPRQKKKIHYMYKTTCKLTNRFYIGIHSTTNIDDGYLGSGKRLRYSIRKYGIENHSKEILNFFENRELLIEEEKKIVNSEMIKDKMCMNLKEGGTGTLSGLSDETIKKIRDGARKWLKEKWKDPEYVKKINQYSSETMKKSHKEGKFRYDTFTGKKHKKESIEKMKSVKKNHGMGIENSQYGTCWITNGDENKKIKKDSIIPEGWFKGRVTK